MSSVEDPVKPSTAISTAGAKSKNVAKKSTSKPAGSLSRNGSFSSGAASPLSGIGSASASREASPEKKLNSILNGQSKHLMNSSTKMNSGDAGNIFKNLRNGAGEDHGRKRQLDPQGDGDNPAKQARMQIENLQQNQEDMLQIMTGERTLTTEEKNEDSGTTSNDGSNGVAEPAEVGSSIVLPSPDSKLVSLNSNEIIVNGKDDDTKENIGNSANSQLSHSPKERSSEKEVVPISDSPDKLEIVESSELCSKLTKKLTPSKTFTLGNRAKDTIKEMLTAAVSRVGKDSLESVSEDCSPSKQIEHCDTSSESGTSDKPEVKNNLFEKLSDISTSLRTLQSKDQPTQGDSQAEVLSEKKLESDSEIKDDSSVKSICDQSSNTSEIATSPTNQTAAEVNASPPTDDKEPDKPSDNTAVGGEDEGSEDQTVHIVEESSDQPDNRSPNGTALTEPQLKEQELILLDGGDSDDNLEIIDDSILDEEPKDSVETHAGDAKAQTSVDTAVDVIAHDESKSCDSATNGTSESDTVSKELTKTITTSSKAFSETNSTLTACGTEDIDCDSKTESLSELGQDSEDVLIAAVEAPEKTVEAAGLSSATDSVDDSKSAISNLTEKVEPNADVVLVPDDSCKRRLSSSSSVEFQIKKPKTEDSVSSENTIPSVKDMENNTSNLVNSKLETKQLPLSEQVKEEKPSNCFNEIGNLQLLTKVVAKGDVVRPTVCSDKTIRISKEGLEHLIQKRINAVLSSPNQSQMLNEMQQRIDFLNDQLTKWKNTAKNFQTKITELTVLNRPERRRANKGPCRHVGIQCEVQASHGQHISPAKSTQKLAPRQPTTPTVATSVQISQTAVSTSVSGQGQTLILPVASASANGNMTCTLLAPSTLPPASANINNTQLRQAIHQGASAPGKTVREMLDTHRGESSNKTQSGSTGTAQVPSSPVVLASPAVPAEAGKTNVKIIDLTEDEENSPSKLAVAVPGVVTAPATGIIVRPPAASPAPGTTNANIRPGTYLVPLTSTQPILLQSIVNQQIRTPQGTTLVYTGPRPAGAAGQQQIIMPAPVGGQQLVTLPAPGQSQIKPGQLVLQQPGNQSAAAAKTVLTTKSSTMSSSKMSHPTTSSQPKIVPKHPAPLPPQPTYNNKSGADLKAMPPKPSLKISRVPQGIVLSWNMVLGDSHADIANYQLFAYQEGTTAPSSSLWKRVGEVKALPLPMACTLTQFQEGNKYHFAVRALDAHSRVGPFSEPSSIHLEAAT